MCHTEAKLTYAASPKQKSSGNVERPVEQLTYRALKTVAAVHFHKMRSICHGSDLRPRTLNPSSTQIVRRQNGGADGL